MQFFFFFFLLYWDRSCLGWISFLPASDFMTTAGIDHHLLDWVHGFRRRMCFFVHLVWYGSVTFFFFYHPFSWLSSWVLTKDVFLHDYSLWGCSFMEVDYLAMQVFSIFMDSCSVWKWENVSFYERPIFLESRKTLSWMCFWHVLTRDYWGC